MHSTKEQADHPYAQRCSPAPSFYSLEKRCLDQQAKKGFFGDTSQKQVMQ